MRSPAFAEGLWEPVEHSFNGLPGTVYNSVLAITFHQCRASRSDASERSGPTLVFPGHGVVQSPTDVCVLLDSQGYTGAFPKPSLPGCSVLCYCHGEATTELGNGVCQAELPPNYFHQDSCLRHFSLNCCSLWVFSRVLKRLILTTALSALIGFIQEQVHSKGAHSKAACFYGQRSGCTETREKEKSKLQLLLHKFHCT